MPTFLLGFKCPPVPEGEERMRLDILGDLACDVLMGESSPLFTRLYSQGLINGTFDSAYDLLPGAAYVFCGGDSNDPEAVQQAVLDEARRVVREGVDPAYVQRIRRALSCFPFGGKAELQPSFFRPGAEYQRFGGGGLMKEAVAAFVDGSLQVADQISVQPRQHTQPAQGHAGDQPVLLPRRQPKNHFVGPVHSQFASFRRKYPRIAIIVT